MARILVVDDEDGIRSFLAETLELEHHSVVQARNGQEALEHLAQAVVGGLRQVGVARVHQVDEAVQRDLGARLELRARGQLLLQVRREPLLRIGAQAAEAVIGARGDAHGGGRAVDALVAVAHDVIGLHHQRVADAVERAAHQAQRAQLQHLLAAGLADGLVLGVQVALQPRAAAPRPAEQALARLVVEVPEPASRRHVLAHRALVGEERGNVDPGLAARLVG